MLLWTSMHGTWIHVPLLWEKFLSNWGTGTREMGLVFLSQEENEFSRPRASYLWATTMACHPKVCFSFTHIIEGNEQNWSNWLCAAHMTVSRAEASKHLFEPNLELVPDRHSFCWTHICRKKRYSGTHLIRIGELKQFEQNSRMQNKVFITWFEGNFAMLCF